MREKDVERPYLFTRMSGQKANDYLHEIENGLGVNLPLHNHIARPTFTTQFLDEGERIYVLQKMLNHSHIQSTMVYVRTTQEAYEQAAQQVDSMFGEWSPLPTVELPKRMKPTTWRKY